MIDIYASATISGLFAGLVSIFIAFAIETFGGQIGGILGAAPSIVIPATIAFWFNSLSANGGLTQTAIIEFQKSALALCPAVVLDSLFLYSWKVVPPILESQPWINRRAGGEKYTLLIIVSLISFGSWFLFAIILTLLSLLIHRVDISEDRSLSTFYIVTNPMQNGVFYFCAACFVLHTICAFSLNWTSSKKASPKSLEPRKSVWIHIGRGAISGVSVFIAVLLSTLNSVLGGLLSLFPAVCHM